MSTKRHMMKDEHVPNTYCHNSVITCRQNVWHRFKRFLLCKTFTQIIIITITSLQVKATPTTLLIFMADFTWECFQAHTGKLHSEQLFNVRRVFNMEFTTLQPLLNNWHFITVYFTLSLLKFTMNLLLTGQNALWK